AAEPFADLSPEFQAGLCYKQENHAAEKLEGTKNMRMLLVAAVAAWLSGPGVLFAQAPSWPTKPVRYIVPFTAGDSPDITGRLLSERLNKLWGQSVIVENRVGAGGTVGAAAAAKAPAD